MKKFFIPFVEMTTQHGVFGNVIVAPVADTFVNRLTFREMRGSRRRLRGSGIVCPRLHVSAETQDGLRVKVTAFSLN